MHGKHLGNYSSSHSLSMGTLTELLDKRVAQFSDRVAYVYEDEKGNTSELTCRQLRDRSLAVASQLSKQADVGDRALLVYPPGLDFISSFFGCLYAGILPVPATYPKPRRPLPRADIIAMDCQPKLVLTHSSVLEGLNLEEQSPYLANVPWEATDILDESSAKEFVPIERTSQDLAFLQYTSGSTLEPRGVMVSHQNILHNLESIRVGFEMAPAEENDHAPVGVFWLPAYHDMGLIGGILCPIYVGVTSYLLAPNTFLRQPGRWLELISETKAEISGAPNFGYELVMQKTTPAEREKLDLQNWRLAFCGAEPIKLETLQDFATAFSASGFRQDAYYPCYGMAEVTLLVTGGRGPAEPKVLFIDRGQLANHKAIPVESSHELAQAVVGCGVSLDGQTIRIVEPRTRQVLPDGDVGEIWVRGGSVACGYWNQEDLNQETFRATLADEEPEEFLRTGDLGFIWEENIFVTGRLKDLIIIRGRNHYPQDIEHTVRQAHNAVDQGAAFSVVEDQQEQLVVVHQIRRESRKADMDEVLQAIRKSIVSEHELDPSHILLIRPVSLPMTTSGKVQRNRCREQFLAGELAVVSEWHVATNDQSIESLSEKPGFLESIPSFPPPQLSEEVLRWLIQWLTQRANLNPEAMQADTPFAELGIDSLSAVEISQDLDQVLGLQLPPMVIWSFPSSAALSEYLAEQLLLDHGESTNGQIKSGEFVAEETSPDVTSVES